MLGSPITLLSATLVWLILLYLYWMVGVGPHPASHPEIAMLINGSLPGYILLEALMRSFRRIRRKLILQMIFGIGAVFVWLHLSGRFVLPYPKEFLIGYVMFFIGIAIAGEVVAAVQDFEGYRADWGTRWERLIKNPQPVALQIGALMLAFSLGTVYISPESIVPALSMIPLFLLVNRFFSWIVIIFFLHDSVDLKAGSILRVRDLDEEGHIISPQRIHPVGILYTAFDKVKTWSIKNPFYGEESGRRVQYIMVTLALVLFLALFAAGMTHMPSWHYSAPVNGTWISWITVTLILSILLMPYIPIGAFILTAPAWGIAMTYLVVRYTGNWNWAYWYLATYVYWIDHIISVGFGSTFGLTTDGKVFMTFVRIDLIWGLIAKKDTTKAGEYTAFSTETHYFLGWTFYSFDPNSLSFAIKEAIAMLYVRYLGLERAIQAMVSGEWISVERF